MRILILEDNADRQVEMSLALRDRFPQSPIEFFSAVAPMRARLGSGGLADVAAIALDHDLEMLPGERTTG